MIPTTTPSSSSPEKEPEGLRRELSLWEFTTNTFGTIVGAGVYVLIGAGIALAGGGVWLAFVLAAFVAGIAVLGYAELGSMYPRAGGEYDFLSHAIGKGLVPYLVGWMLTLNGSASLVTLALGFGEYLRLLVPISPWFSALILIVILTAAVLFGLKLDTRANLVLTAVEAGGLLIIIVLGASRWGTGQIIDWPQGMGGVLSATALLFFAYTGFEDATKMGEEVLEPGYTFPFGLLLGLGLTALFYTALSLTIVQLAPVEALAGSGAPLSIAVGQVWGPAGELFLAVVAMFSIANTALFVLVAHSRLIFAMARGGSLPPVLSRILPRTAVPWISTLAAGILALALVPLGEVEVAGGVASWSALLVYASVSAALIVLRFREPRASRPFRVPFNVGNFPVLAALAILVTLALSLRLDWQIIALGLIVAALGVIAYPFLRQRTPT